MRAAVVLLLVLAGCAGVKARDELLPPAMLLQFGSIEPQVRTGILAKDPPLTTEQVAAVESSLAAVRAALESGNRAALLPIDWPSLRGLAESGIMSRVQRGELGLGVAQSLLERLRLFSEAWTVSLAR